MQNESSHVRVSFLARDFSLRHGTATRNSTGILFTDQFRRPYEDKRVRKFLVLPSACIAAYGTQAMRNTVQVSPVGIGFVSGIIGIGMWFPLDKVTPLRSKLYHWTFQLRRNAWTRVSATHKTTHIACTVHHRVAGTLELH